MSVETREDAFKRQLVQHYAECKKYIIPKSEYYRTVDILRAAAANVLVFCW